MMPAGLLLVAAGMLAPQGRVVDQGEFVVTRGGMMIGREQFTVRRNRTRRGDAGFLIEARARYGDDLPGIELRPVVELGSDSLPVAVQMDATGDADGRFVMVFGPRRVTLRTESHQREAAREFPVSGRAMVVDDSVVSLYAVPPGLAPGPLDLFYPRSGRRVSGSLRAGTNGARGGDGPRPLRHLIIDSGRSEAHLWYDQTGRLMKVELPALGVVATRSRSR